MNSPKDVLGHNAYRVRLYPNEEQKQVLAKHFGCARFVYNKFLAAKIAYYKRTGKGVSFATCCSKLTQLKKKLPWLAEVDSTCLQQALKNLDAAYQNFFRRCKQGGVPGFPKFKSKHDNHHSFRVVMGNAVEDNYLKIGKVGWIKFRGLRDTFPHGIKIQSITVSMNASGDYYASILVKQETKVTDHRHKEYACGIDVGVAVPLTLVSDSGKCSTTGRNFKLALLKKEQRRKHYQRMLARKQKGSNNRNKIKRRVARAYRNEANLRTDYNHRCSTKIAKHFHTVVIEDLKVNNMTRSAKGTAEAPGTNVAAKAGLNREILRLGWSQFTSFLAYKTAKYGGELIRVRPAYTSQTCSSCGTVDKASRENQSRFKCVHCGFTLNADHNAARNILAKGLGH